MRPLHLVVTDSGLGGLAICAGLELALRRRPSGPAVRLTYVNAWPEEGRGYNDLPDVAARAAAFDRALAAIDALAPDQLVIACNTLSILHEHTAHRRRGGVPVHGIIEAGVEMFEAAARAQPSSALVLIGTRTTIDSAVHADALRRRGVPVERVAGASCHGLATAIEADPFGADTERAIDACCARAAAAAPPGAPLLLGLCCTHYGFVRARLEAALARHARREVTALDPNARLAQAVAARLAAGPAPPGPDAGPADLQVSVLSKVRLADGKRRNIATLLEPVSPATARALRDYTCAPQLF